MAWPEESLETGGRHCGTEKRQVQLYLPQCPVDSLSHQARRTREVESELVWQRQRCNAK
jgi:hypothetical protein